MKHYKNPLIYAIIALTLTLTGCTSLNVRHGGDDVIDSQPESSNTDTKGGGNKSQPNKMQTKRRCCIDLSCPSKMQCCCMGPNIACCFYWTFVSFLSCTGPFTCCGVSFAVSHNAASCAPCFACMSGTAASCLCASCKDLEETDSVNEKHVAYATGLKT